ncbi:FeoC-like transcriptional regulator [Streptomyces sp. NPDC101733]|uniref:FeoC-like transcriptional regulator n=1 Tax=unclassified Streptomyces TaxID=2593676 RepID=UPI0038128972
MSGPASPLRDFLREFERAAPGEGMAAIAERLGVSTAEAAALAAYWVRKGRLRREEIGGSDCSDCAVAAGRACGGCPSSAPGEGRGRATLVALSPVRHADRPAGAGPRTP